MALEGERAVVREAGLRRLATVALAVALAPLAGCSSPVATEVSLPTGDATTLLHDLRWASGSARVVAATDSSIALVDPESLAIDTFSTQPAASIDEGDGALFFVPPAGDRVLVADESSRAVVATAPLSAPGSSVRWIASARELWVTEPSAIEVFRVAASSSHGLSRVGAITLPSSPVALAVDASARVDVLLGDGRIGLVRVTQHAVGSLVSAPCASPVGLTLDAFGRALVACSGGELAVLDLDTRATIGSGALVPGGLDALGIYGARVLALGGDAARLTVLELSPEGALTVTGSFDTAPGARKLAVDASGDAWTWAPDRGELLELTEIDLRP